MLPVVKAVTWAPNAVSRNDCRPLMSAMLVSALPPGAAADLAADEIDRIVAEQVVVVLGPRETFHDVEARQG